MKIRPNSIIVTVTLLICFIQVTAQTRYLTFEHDTIFLSDFDSIISQTGDKFNGKIEIEGEVNEKIEIRNGFITKRTVSAFGHKWYEENYQDRKLNGKYTEWDRRGNIICKGYFVDNLLDSIWTYYYSNGKKSAQGLFSKDSSKCVKSFKIYIKEVNRHDNSERKSHIDNYQRPVGIWTFYNRKGKVIKEINFEDRTLDILYIGEDYY